MSGKLHGAPQLKARLRALKVAFKPIGRSWATETRDISRRTVSIRTGKGRASIRVRHANMNRATVYAIYYISILDKGHRAYTIKPKRKAVLAFQSGGRTVFARKVHKPAQSGTGFARRAALEALQNHPMAETLIRQWNAAA